MPFIRSFILISFFLIPINASATVFNFVCDTPSNCDGDTDLSFSIEIDDSVISANGSYSTGTDAGAAILGWTFSSSVGGGFLIQGAAADIFNGTPYVGFTFDSNSVLSGMFDTDKLTDIIIEGDELLIFGNASGTDTSMLWVESNTIFSRHGSRAQDGSYERDLTEITGHFIQVETIPEPSIIALISLGLLGFSIAHRKENKD